MYLGLFLTPWVLMYALSSLVFNHFATIRSWYEGGALNTFELVDEVDYKDAFEPGVSPQDAARQILLDVNQDGPHFVRGNLEGERLTITRPNTYRVIRITYLIQEGRVLVEKQVPNLPTMLTRMHTRHGYEQSYTSAKLWGLGVEITVLAMLFWIASGVWLWWTIKPARLWGGGFAMVGLGLFLLLMFSM